MKLVYTARPATDHPTSNESAERVLSASQNARLTRSGPGTPAGALLRRYWQPVALREELEGPRPVRAVRLLGEDLALFRHGDSGYGLLGRHCPHRGADLCFGRLEDGGLRCAFHGWLLDAAGRCLEQPGEPEGSTFHTRIAHTAYPCRERNGIVFAYLGPGDPPPLPGLDCFAAPDAYSFAFKGYIDCNWLQALEIGIDPAHASFLHRYLEDEDPASGYGKQFRDRAGELDVPLTRILRDHPRARIEVEVTDYGLRIAALRRLADGRTHVRVTNQVFPQAIAIPMSNTMTLTQWHVPVDDRRCYWYAIFTSFDQPVDKARMREQRLELYTLPDYLPRLNRDNDYGFDPEEQRTRTYTGMGLDINVHDQWAVESMGALQDRSREHLGRTDVAIRAYRALLDDAIEAAVGERPLPGLGVELRGPAALDAIAADDDWQGCWQARDRERRAACAWSPGAPARSD